MEKLSVEKIDENLVKGFEKVNTALVEINSKADSLSSGIKGSLEPNSPKPVNKGQYVLITEGEYINIKNKEGETIEITEEDLKNNIIYVVYNGEYFVKSKVPINIGRDEKNGVAPLDGNKKIPNENLTFGKVEQGDNNTVSGGEVYKGLTYYNNKPFKTKYDNADVEYFFSLIEDIFIIENGVVSNPKDLGINYIWINSRSANGEVGFFGFQITLNSEDYSNFGLHIENTSNDIYTSGNLIELQQQQQPLQPLQDKIKIYVKFKGIVPNKTIFLQYTDRPFYVNCFKPLKNHNIINVNVEKDGNNAIQNAINSITDATALNTYEIRVSQGTYKATNSTDFKGHRSDYPAFICPKDYVSITGVDENDCVIYAGLPFNDNEVNTGISRNMHQTVYNYANESKMENLTIISENIRYTIHQDSPLETNKKRYYKNVTSHFKGSKGYRTTLGIGTYSGSETYFDGGKSICDAYRVLSIHNNQAFKMPSKWSFKNHKFINLNNDELIELANSGSLVGDKLELIGCSFGGAKVFNYIDLWIYTHLINSSYNHAEWRVIGYGNEPFYFNNKVEGYSFAVRSLSTGDDSKIRFKGGSAYDLIIRNTHKNKFGFIGSPDRQIIDNSYIAFDGGGQLNGYAIGCVGVREKKFDNGEQNNQEPLGKRLGDCTSVSKTLIVEINGVDKIIWFDQDYRNKTNSEIINSINLFLNTVGAEAYITNVGLDYYPELSDVNFLIRNASTTESIKKGTIVTIENNSVKICTENDIPFGLLIDDLKPYKVNNIGIVSGFGRVIKNCFITTAKGNISSVLTQGSGNSFRVENGVLIADENGNIKSNGNLILIN